MQKNQPALNSSLRRKYTKPRNKACSKIQVKLPQVYGILSPDQQRI
ncbi:hypothetical protein NEOC65_000296 [Neochlamydia sp. AcF65]|nr:hypothetical protein [Neochlamydia sp. AcF65]